MVTLRDQHRVRQGAAADRLDSRVAVLVWAVAALALAAAVPGLVVDGLYAGARSTTEILRGYDLVTAVIVVPALCLATLQACRGSLLGRLVTAGLLADLVYGYAFYVFGTGFNVLFLLHITLFSASLTALVLTIAGLDVGAVADWFRGVRHVWPVAVALGLLAVSLGGMWISAGVGNAVAGTVPAGSAMVETDQIVHLSMVLDLAVQVPLYATAAVLVWRRIGWGYVLAFVALISGIPEQLSYLVAMPLQVSAGIPEAVSLEPLEPVILAMYVLGLVVLLAGRPRRAAAVTS